MAETPLPAALTEAVAALWRMRTPGPTNLWSDPRFVRLCDACERLYRNTGSADATPLAIELALSDAVQALGLPIGLVPANAQLSIPFKRSFLLCDFFKPLIQDDFYIKNGRSVAMYWVQPTCCRLLKMRVP